MGVPVVTIRFCDTNVHIHLIEKVVSCYTPLYEQLLGSKVQLIQ